MTMLAALATETHKDQRVSEDRKIVEIDEHGHEIHQQRDEQTLSSEVDEDAIMQVLAERMEAGDLADIRK